MDLLRKLTPAPDVTVYNNVLRSMGVSGRQFPFGNPVSIERRHVPYVQETPYWVTEKTDGTRVALVLGQTSTGSCQAFLVDRTLNVYGFAVDGGEIYFSEGSVFDAELVWNPVAQTYFILVFDVGRLGGYTDEEAEARGDPAADDPCGIAAKPYSVRRQALRKVFTSSPLAVGTNRASVLHDGYILAKRPDVCLLVKDMIPLETGKGTGMDPDALRMALPRPDHPTDGYILTPEDEPAPRPGIAKHIFKIKSSHTVDLLWEGGTLWFGDGAMRLPLSELPIGEDLPARPTFTHSELASVRSGSIVELEPDVSLKLTFLKVRPDRESPNGMVSLTRTLKSALDAVTLDDVLTGVA